jgi:O-antigen/teichoic acid export membrane protein
MNPKGLSTLLGLTDARSRMLGKNILASVVLKVISIACSLLVVRMTLNYLDNEIYGIWLTMTSILFWFSYFDVGVGNGMRNYLAQAVSNGDYKLGKAYISTTFALLLLIAAVIVVLIAGVLPFVDWNALMNTHALPNATLRNVLIVAMLFTLASFLLRNVGVIFMSLQRFAVNDLLVTTGNVLSMIVIYILTKTTTGHLMYVTFAFTAPPVLVFLVAAFPIFHRYPQLRPSFKSVQMELSKKLIGKGLGFFFIQITSCLVIYGSSNVFISRYCGPSEVTVYNIAYKYFSLIVMAYTIMISPLWNAYTDAYEKNEMDWIRRSFNKSAKLWGLACLVGLVMLAFAGIFYHIWIGNAVYVPLKISICVLAYVSMFNLNSCLTCLLNGLNTIRVQLYTSVAATALYLVLVKFVGPRYGAVGIALAMALCYLLMSLVHLYQCRLIINGKAKGVWLK